MFETILVPLDGSELAEESLGAASEMRQKFGSRLILLRAVDSMTQLISHTTFALEAPAAAAAEAEAFSQALEAEREEATKYLESLRQKLGPAGVEALVVEGPTPDAIARVSEERGVGLIVMTSHGRGGLGRLIFGSVTDAVLRHSTVPVLLSRSFEKKEG